MFTRGIIVAGAIGSGALATAIGVRSAFAVGGSIEIVSALLIARALSTTSLGDAEATRSV